LIISGNTRILFDGTYKIKEIPTGNHKYKVMTFNHEGDIKKKPDKRFVKSTDQYFPGTMISVKIYLNENELVTNKTPSNE